MKRAIVVLGNVDTLPKFDCDVIGVDYGAQVLAEQKVSMVCAIGDFDSVDGIDDISKAMDRYLVDATGLKEKIDLNADKIVKLDNYDCLDIYGGLGGRLDHEFANLALLMYRKYPITYYNASNKLYCLDSGVYTIKKEDYTYISFFPLKESVVSLRGVVYPLDQQKVDVQDIYMVSNEIVGEEMEMELEGELLVMQSNDNKKTLF